MKYILTKDYGTIKRGSLIAPHEVSSLYQYNFDVYFDERYLIDNPDLFIPVSNLYTPDDVINIVEHITSYCLLPEASDSIPNRFFELLKQHLNA